MNHSWEPLADNVFRCRLPFLDVTIGLVVGTTGTIVIDTGTTLTEAHGIHADARAIAGGEVTHVLMTHQHFDHVLGSSVFGDAELYCAPAVATAIGHGRDRLRADAIHHGADPDDVARAVEALRAPDHAVTAVDIDLGDRVVTVRHPGRGHTDHDLIATITTVERTVVFCGDLVEESGDPVIDADSDPQAWPDTLDRLLEYGGTDGLYVPGHGAVVDAAFVHRQRAWLARQV